MAGIVQAKFRGRNDDGNETTATWKAAKNTNFSQAVDTNFRLRLQLNNTHPTDPLSAATRFQYNKNGAGWNDITTSSSVVKAVTSVNVADTTATTVQMGGLSFIAGEVTADGLTASVTQNSLQTTEHELICQIVSTDVVNNDSIQIRGIISPSTAYDSYTNTPTITVTEAVTFIPKVI